MTATRMVTGSPTVDCAGEELTVTEVDASDTASRIDDDVLVPYELLPPYVDELSVVVVAAVTMDCVSEALLVAKLTSPEYVARTGWLPVDGYVAEHVALPPLIATAPQPVIVVPLPVKAKVPVGEPVPGEATPIVAV